ncbi:hypothetical protein HDG40_007625 [Paraburkholderia sp. JPY158]|uniref:Uncharacterized protein n=1 Tax=Paraburkholderia atlantica TaxID=2654982 RepID=A0A7W8VB07_PARAM|nr:hypothetical protein [Paraburkholderia atlantica]
MGLTQQMYRAKSATSPCATLNSRGLFRGHGSHLHSITRVAQLLRGQACAVILGRTLQLTCEIESRAGYDGYKRKRLSKVNRGY